MTDKKLEEKPKGIVGKVKEHIEDKEEQLVFLSTIVRLSVLVWSAGIEEAGKYVPVEHDSQFAWPVTDWYCPPTHTLQVGSCGTSPNVPCAHFCICPSEQLFPTAHTLHCDTVINPDSLE